MKGHVYAFTKCKGDKMKTSKAYKHTVSKNQPDYDLDRRQRYNAQDLENLEAQHRAQYLPAQRTSTREVLLRCQDSI